MKLKVIVTGGAGFIGSHTVEALLKLGHDVVAIDNLSTGNTSNIKAFQNNPQFKFVESDINNSEKIDSHFKGANWVIHLAALADVVPSIEKPIDYHRSNVDGTVSVLELAKKHGVSRFVYAASSSCYGIPDVYPTPETTKPDPQYPYALTKYLGEEYVLHWGKIYKLPVVSLRFFNVYGPRSRTSGTYGAVFGVFLAQKLKNHPYTVVGDGTQKRDFTFVTDVVDAIITAAKSDVKNEVFNVGTGAPVSVNQIVDLLEGEKVHIPKRPGEPDLTFAKVEKIQKVLGWKSKIDIATGVKELLANIDYWREAPLWTPNKIEEATKTWFQYLDK